MHGMHYFKIYKARCICSFDTKWRKVTRDLDTFLVENLNSFLEPGQRVQHPNQPDWGIGQVQSNVNNHITVNFPEAGKVVIDGSRIVLILVN